VTPEEEIRNLFAAYAAGFDDADAAAVTKRFVYPTTIWQAGKGLVFENAEALAKNVEALIDVFDEAGIFYTIPEVREVVVAGGAAFASVHWRQEDPDHITLNEFTCRYLLVSRGGNWRIATVVNEAVD
jgi:ketosteroid isomerase-like protein